jgi:hypothetical protein
VESIVTGDRVSKKYKAFCTLCAVIVIAAGAANCFMPETIAIAWHVRHGFSAETNRLRFKIPLLYSADVDRQGQSIQITTLSGAARYRLTSPEQFKMALIDVRAAQPARGSAEQDVATRRDLMARLGYQHQGQRDAMLAGTTGKCMEYAGPPIGDSGVHFGTKNIEIHCTFGDFLSASFTGTPGAVNDFYELLQSAEPIKGSG